MDNKRVFLNRSIDFVLQSYLGNILATYIPVYDNNDHRSFFF